MPRSAGGWPSLAAGCWPQRWPQRWPHDAVTGHSCRSQSQDAAAGCEPKPPRRSALGSLTADHRQILQIPDRGPLDRQHRSRAWLQITLDRRHVIIFYCPGDAGARRRGAARHRRALPPAAFWQDARGRPPHFRPAWPKVPWACPGPPGHRPPARRSRAPAPQPGGQWADSHLPPLMLYLPRSSSCQPSCCGRRSVMSSSPRLLRAHPLALLRSQRPGGCAPDIPA